jgi:hypothetical protein
LAKLIKLGKNEVGLMVLLRTTRLPFVGFLSHFAEAEDVIFIGATLAQKVPFRQVICQSVFMPPCII